jgi:hypothetical protein
MGKWNNSCHVVRDFGTSSGLSSFNISPVLDSYPLNVSEEENEKNHTLIFRRRPDIRLSYAERWSASYVETLMNSGDHVSEEEIKKYQNSATFIPAVDAFRNCQRYETRENMELRPRALVGRMETFNDTKTANLTKLALPSGLHPLLVLGVSLEQYCAEWSSITDCQPKNALHPLLASVKDIHRSLLSSLSRPNYGKMKIINRKFKEDLLASKRPFLHNNMFSNVWVDQDSYCLHLTTT